jgi:hypothetical protein
VSRWLAGVVVVVVVVVGGGGGGGNNAPNTGVWCFLKSSSKEKNQGPTPPTTPANQRLTLPSTRAHEPVSGAGLAELAANRQKAAPLLPS